MIPSSKIQEIKEASDIVEVIGEFVTLKKSGNSYKGLSPFNSEKTPSFNVIPEKKFFKDFSSGKGGDVFTFLVEHEKMTFIEAVKWVAKKYNITIDEKKGPPIDESIQVLYHINEEAKNFYRMCYFSGEVESKGMTYMGLGRGYEETTVDHFHVGWVPYKWNLLCNYLKDHGYALKDVERAGLAIKHEKDGEIRYFDRFRGRVMFPIRDVAGRVIAFGGRIVDKEDQVKMLGAKADSEKIPKYINSSESPIYHKSDNFFGLYEAKEHIRKEGFAYLLEGYTDTMSHWQIDLKNTISSSGTALKEGQLRLLKKYTDVITIIFDGDAAGSKAAFEGMDTALAEGFHLTLVSLPLERKDPDKFIRDADPEAYKAYITDKQNKVSFITFKCNYANEGIETDPKKKQELIHSIINSIARIPDPVAREVSVNEASKVLNISKETLMGQIQKNFEVKEKKEKEEELQKNAKQNQEALIALKTDMQGASGNIKTDEELIMLLVNYGTYYDRRGKGMAGQIIEKTKDYHFANKRAFALFTAHLHLVDHNTGLLQFKRTLDRESENYLSEIKANNRYLSVSKGNKEREPYITLNEIKLEIAEAIIQATEKKLGREEDKEAIRKLLKSIQTFEKIKMELESELNL